MAPEPESDGTGLEKVEKSEMRYGAEPRFPWPLALAWALFVIWGIYYATTRLVPAFKEWTPR